MLVQGSVRRSKNRVRIVAQLVDPRTDEHLWAETYDRDLDDIFAIQTDVALQIAAAMRAELTLEERSGAIYGIKGSYLFASLRDHPRFQALLRRMNL